MSRALIRRRLRESAFVKILFAQKCAEELDAIAALLIKTLRAGRSVFVLGNGGSAADAQHFAAELEGRLYRNRRPLPILALTTNSSSLTAIGNDFGYEHTFSRQVEAHGRRGDVLVAISTSGKSPNVLKAVAAARRKGIRTVGFTGEKGARLRRAVDLCLTAPSDDVARIQECHGAAVHILCEAVEEALFGRRA